MLGQFADAFFAVDGEEDRRHKSDQGLVGADVGGRLLAPDVLLASGEGEDKATIAVAVDGLADQATGHLAQILFFGCDDAAIRTAVAERYAERLGFHADDIRLDGWSDDAEGDRFRDGDDEQGAFGVGDFGNGGNVFDDAEKVRALDEDCGGFGGDGGLECSEVDASGFASWGT